MVSRYPLTATNNAGADPQNRAADLGLRLTSAVLGHRGGMKEDPDDPGFLLPRHGKKLMWLTIAGALLAAISGLVALAQGM